MYPQADVVYSDLSKTCDKINHDLLMKNLNTVCVHGSLLKRVESYIGNRTQAVCLKGYCSKYL